MNAAKDNEKLENVFANEARALVDAWMDEDFPPKLMRFMQSVMKSAKPKL